MRPHEILLLLLGSLAVANACVSTERKADGSMKTMTNSPTLRLACDSPNQKIEYAQQHFEQLDCDLSGKWTHGGVPLLPHLADGGELEFKCVAKTSPVPVVDTICRREDTVTGNVDVRHDSSLVCDKATEEIEYAQERFEQLDCVDGKWTHGIAPLTPPIPADKHGQRILKYKCVPKLPSVPVTDKCDRSLISGPAPGEFTYDANNKLTCNDGKAIEHEPHYRFDELVCDRVYGWYGIHIDEEKKTSLVRFNLDDNEALEIKCVTACHSSLIRGFDAGKMHWKYGRLSCKTGSDPITGLEYIVAGKKRMAGFLQCELGRGWRHEFGALTTIKDTAEITVACVTQACNPALVSLGEGVKQDANKLSCLSPDDKLEIDNDRPTEGAEYRELSCDAEHGWSSNAIDIDLNGYEELAVRCVPRTSSKCDPSLIRGLAPEEIHFDEATRKLTCVSKRERSLTSIESNSLRFNFLTCDAAGGWWGRTIEQGAVNEKLIAVDSAKLSIACVEYCHSAGAGTKFEKVIVQNIRLKQNEEYIKVSCEDSSRELFYGGRHTGGSASCSGEVGWILPDDPIPSDTMTATALFECREVTPATRDPVTSTLKPALIPTTKQAPVTTTTAKPASVSTPSPAPTTTTTLRPTVEETWTTHASGDNTRKVVGAVVSTTTIVCCAVGVLLLVLGITAILCCKNAAKKRAEMIERADESAYKNYEMSDSNMEEV